MIKIKKLATKIFLSILLLIAFFTTQNFLLFNNMKVFSDEIVKTTNAVNLIDQNTSNQEDLSSKVSNNNFMTTSTGSSTITNSNYTGDTNIKVPGSWTKIGTVDEKADVKSLYVGVVDVSNSEFTNEKKENNFGLDADVNPYLQNMVNDSKVLMINSKSQEKLFGYSSSSITLDANSFYAVSVNVYTGSSNPTVSVALSGDDFNGKAETIISDDIQTNKNWGTATFWVATSQTKKSTATLNLYLGRPTWQSGSNSALSSGHVFFDNVKLLKVSKNYFDSVNKESDFTTYNYKSVVDLRYDDITENDGFVTNGNITSSENWEISQSGNSMVKFVSATSDINQISAPLTNARTNDSTVAMMYVEKNTTATGTITSQPITINKQQIYRISFWAKTNASSFKASIEPTAKVNGTSYSAVSISTASTTEQKTTNDWNEYAFFVKGNSLFDAEVKLTLGLSSTNPSTAQYVFFDNITSQKITSSSLTDASSAGITNSTLDLNPSDSLTIKNGYFNTASGIDVTNTYPLTPSNWTLTTESLNSNKNFSGIVNLEEDVFAANRSNFGYPTRPNSSIYSENSNNNVLMMANTSADAQLYTSDSSISASANTSYVLKVNICTDISEQTTAGANIYIKNSDNVVIAQMLDIQTYGKWTTYSIYLGNCATAQTLTISIGFGREEKQVKGFAYFDDITWDSTTETLSDISENSTTQVVNLNKTQENTESTIYSDDFSGYDKTTNGQISTPYYWKGAVKDISEEEATPLDTTEIVAGIVNGQNINKVLSNKTIATNSNKNTLMIYSPTKTYYYFTNNLSFSLSANSYYRITLNVKTIALENEEVFASVVLKNVDKSFSKIDTNGKFSPIDDDWFKYTIYINPTETLNLVMSLGLGNDDELSSGYAFFEDLQIVKLSEEQFTVDMEADQADTNKAERVISVVNTSEDSDSETPTRTYSESLAWLAIPTVIIAIGIIVALVGFSIKKYVAKRPVRVKVENSYDRSATLLQDLDHKNYKTSVNHKLKLLRDELEQTEKYLEEEKLERQKQIDAFETAKEIAEQDNSIKLENPNKKNSDYQERIGKLEKNIASIKVDISILEKEQERIKKQEIRRHANDLKGNKITKRK